jgi:hypothetical protein
MIGAVGRVCAVLLLACAPRLAAADVIGPQSVFDGGFACYPDGGSLQPYLACLAAQGAGPAAVAAVQALAAPKYPVPGGYDEAGIVTGFTEYGQVDVATVFFPGRANTNEETLFVNGVTPFGHPYDFLTNQPPDDAATRALMWRHPQAFPYGQPFITGYRRLPDGSQSFVVVDRLVDGCRACDPVGLLLGQMHFRDGYFSMGRMLGYTGMSLDIPAPARRATLLRGDIAMLQMHLNLAGYAAGGMDGVAGRSTADALASFLADQCFAPAAGLGPAAIDRLIELAGARGPVPALPCATVPVVEPTLPGVRDGAWVADPRLCAAMLRPESVASLEPSLRDWVQGQIMAGETAYHIGDGSLYWGHGGCRIARVAPAAKGMTVGMDCSGEGATYTMTRRIEPLSDWLILIDDRYFQRCTD